MIGLWVALSASALAEPPAAVALVTGVTGDAQLKIKGQPQTTPVVAFTTLHTGDRVLLGAESELELTWLGGQDATLFSGPGQVTVKGDGAKPSRGAELEVEPLDPEVARSLQTLSTVLRYAELGRPGAAVIRGNPAGPLELDETERAQVAAARMHYEGLRASSEDADILPELYLASILLALGLYDDARTPLAEAQQRCGACPVSQQLASWLD